MKGMLIAEELFAWFVDTLENIKGRLPSALLLGIAVMLIRDARQWHAQQKEAGLRKKTVKW